MQTNTKKTDNTPGKNKLQILIKIGGLLLGIFLIYWFISKSNLSGIVGQLQRINFNFIFLIGVTFSAYLMVTIAWKQSFMKPFPNLSISRLFILRQVGESLAQVNPTNVIAGDALKAVLLKKNGIPYKDSIVSLTISRFIIMISAVSLILIGVFLFFDSLKLHGSKYSIIIVVTFTFIILFALVYLLRSGRGILVLPILLLSFLQKRFSRTDRFSKTIEKLKEIDTELINFYKTKKIYFLSAYILSFLHWLTGAMEFYFILYFLGYKVSFLSCIAMEVGVMVFKAMGAFVPGQIGIEEYANKMMLELVNVSGPGLWITVSILRRARQLFWICAGLILFFFVIKDSKDLDNGSIVYNS